MEDRQKGPCEPAQSPQTEEQGAAMMWLDPEEQAILEAYRSLPQGWRLDARDSMYAAAADWDAYLDAMGPDHRGWADWLYTLSGNFTGKDPHAQAMALDILEQEINARLPAGWILDHETGEPVQQHGSQDAQAEPTLGDWIQIEMDASSAAYTRLAWVQAGHPRNEPIPEGWSREEEQTE